MKNLYFDIDGTLLDLDSGIAKPALANGNFEKTLKSIDIQQLICVGSFVDVVHALKETYSAYDEMGELFQMCGGVFADENWFREKISLVKDSSNRAAEINFDEDWWYVDDLAEHFFHTANLDTIFDEYIGTRILVPSPKGDGNTIQKWLNREVI
jgi:hypothetical protein